VSEYLRCRMRPGHGMFRKFTLLFRPPSLDLTRISNNNLWNASICLDRSSYANRSVCVAFFGSSKFRAVFRPDHDCENLVRVWSVEIDECGRTATAIGKVTAGDLPTNFGVLPNVIAGLRGGNHPLPKCTMGNSQKDSCSEPELRLPSCDCSHPTSPFQKLSCPIGGI
jgi:hypothetical protein